MKPFRALLAFLVGTGVGVVLVLANPLVQVGELEPLHRPTRSKTYSAVDTRGFDISLPQFLGTDGSGSSPALLEDSANRHARVSVMVLPAGDGVSAGLAVKVSTLSPQNSLWRARLGTLDSWNIAWPGEGSVFASGYSNYWSLLRDLAWSTVRSRGELELAPAYALSALPPIGHFTGILGASGRFAGLPGHARESVLPQSHAPPTWVLDVRIDKPVVTQAANRPAPRSP